MTTITIEKRLLEQLYLYWLEDADPDELDEFRDEVRAAILAAQPSSPARKPKAEQRDDRSAFDTLPDDYETGDY